MSMMGQGGGAQMHSRKRVTVAPVNSVAPVISGTVLIGNVLSCTTGTWSMSPTYAYQWRRNGIAISGETASTHTMVAADCGVVITCVVTATDGGSANATSNSLAYDQVADIGAPLRLLVDESLITASGGLITLWENQATGVNDFTAATTDRPNHPFTVNGLIAPDFNGTVNYMTSTSTLTDLITPGTPELHGFVVFNLDGISTSHPFSFAAANAALIQNQPAYCAASLNHDSGSPKIQLWFYSTVYEGVELGPLTYGTTHVVEWWITGGVFSARLDGGSVSTDASIGTIPVGAARGGPLWLGRSGGTFVNGRIAMALVCNAVMTANQQSAARNICANKWGCTI